MQNRALGPFSVANVALGCMNFCHAYGSPVSTEQSHAVLHAGLDAGVTMFDTAALYGFGASESLIGPVLKPHRNHITLASKGGMAGVRGHDGVMRRVIDGHPKTLRQNCEDSLKRLGTDVIDLYYLHRWDKNVPIEESVGEMARLKEEGKVRALGLSEVGVDALRRAHKEHPIAALQSEYSLWTREPESDVLPTCAELGIAFVAYSPLGRAFLTGQVNSDTLSAGDFRSHNPRFQGEAGAANAQLVAQLGALAQQWQLSNAQLALAWLLNKQPNVIPIPGTRRRARLEENLAAANVQLDAGQMAQIEAVFSSGAVQGQRYPDAGWVGMEQRR